MGKNNIKCLVVDDSAVVRTRLTQILTSDPDVEVIGTAPDPFIARDLIEINKPDVIILDIEMPRMDGITFLKRIMEFYPIPIVIVSSLTAKNRELALEALAEGAFDVVDKNNAAFALGEIGPELLMKVKAAAKVRLSAVPRSKASGRSTPERKSLTESTQKIVAIGASTGGVKAIQQILMEMPHNAPALLIVQHMPPNFAEAFAQRINSQCEIKVSVGKDGDIVRSGHAFIAPGDYHMCLRRSGSLYQIELNKEARRSYHRPSVNTLFESVAEFAGRNAVGVILTGMGNDGAEGLRQMQSAGAKTIAQDEKTSVIFGMPMEAIRLGAADMILPLDEISDAILKLVKN